MNEGLRVVKTTVRTNPTVPVLPLPCNARQLVILARHAVATAWILPCAAWHMKMAVAPASRTGYGKAWLRARHADNGYKNIKPAENSPLFSA